MDANKVIKRLSPNKIWRGPEWFGCMNTGNRPALATPSVSRKSIGWIVVGSEMEVEEVIGRGVFGWSVKDSNWLYGDKGGKHPTKKVWKFKSRQGAMNKFQKLIDDVLLFNEGERAEIRRVHASDNVEDKIAFMLDY